ncbi:ABC transporter substrate-binding protein [Allokutzneria oryzae]|uniref:ABC transporter substrate-binding protein n=1 Tax=Allokutzneria oryzae TaxID=1378989 RepID=A0ABV6A1F1_9PSEU
MVTPLFRGLNALLAVCHRLLDRPRWWQRPSPDAIRGDRPLPLLGLIKDSKDPVDHDVLGTLESSLGQDSPRTVLLARASAEQARQRCADRWAKATPPRTEDRLPLLPLLDELSHKLMADRFSLSKLRRFRYYGLGDWLSGQELAPGPDPHDEISQRLQDWYTKPGGPDATQLQGALDAALPQSDWMKNVLALFVLLRRPMGRFVWRRLGRVPRWFMRQPFMVPGHSTDFVGFAERLTEGRRTEENVYQLKKLLVHAFLQDLRVAYRPRRLLPARWRRTSYVMVLLDEVSEDNGGWELLRLINDVRNESTEHDPLLVVATAASRPAGVGTDRVTRPVVEIEDEIAQWQRDLPARRQALRADARFVFLALPGSDGGDEPPVGRHGLFDARRPPLLARRRVLALVMVLVLGAAALAGGEPLFVRWRSDCLHPFSPGVGLRWLDEAMECVGYSDNAARVFGSDPRLRAAQLAVFEHNGIAKRLHAENPRRPLVTLVYFSDLTHTNADPGMDASTAEELEGLLLRQRQQNHKDQSKPLLRVIVANGGHAMSSARTVVDELLAPLFRDDASVLGVVGMGLTVPATESAIAALGDLGIAVVSMTLTGESLPDLSPLYFQLVPGNRAQAELVAEYARQGRRSVTVYHPPLDDGYLRSLVEETRNAVGVDRVRTRQWMSQVAELSITCGADQLAFFVGREVDFPGFLDEVVRRCDANQPVVVGSDTVSRFVAQSDQRLRDEFSGVAVSFVSLASRIVLAGRSCREDGRPSSLGGAAPTHSLSTFCAGYRSFRGLREHGPDEVATVDFARVLSPAGDHLPWPGERIGLAYDAGGVFLEAVRRNQVRSRVSERAVAAPHRAAIGQELRELRPFDGATGPVDFAGSRTGESRPISILRVSDLHELSQVPTCVFRFAVPVDRRVSRPWGSPGC